MELELTNEQLQASISAAYDSVSLINDLKLKDTLTEEDTACLERNIKHIEIMLGKEWFIGALNSSQKTELQSIIK
jgi:hypothetical protein